jgi:hypothetical protein
MNIRRALLSTVATLIIGATVTGCGAASAAPTATPRRTPDSMAIAQCLKVYPHMAFGSTCTAEVDGRTARVVCIDDTPNVHGRRFYVVWPHKS